METESLWSAGGRASQFVATARAAAPSGSVDVYEASEQLASGLVETMNLNAVADRTTVHHAAVGRAIGVTEEMGDASVIAPSELPGCDVLQLDCEGAELSILEGLSDYPETVIVETHPRFDAPTEKVRDVLGENGYTIVQSRPDPVAGKILLARQVSPPRRTSRSTVQ